MDDWFVAAETGTFYFFNFIASTRETLDNGDYLNHNFCLETANWYQSENWKFPIKMVLINFQKEKGFV